MAKNYVFMGTPEFGAICLKILCEKYFPPKLVITQNAKNAGRGQKLRHSEVANFAFNAGLEVCETDNTNSDTIYELIKNKSPDLIIVVAFGQILKEKLLRLPKLFCLNVHASLLPKYRGASPIQHAILNGEKKTGITIQKIVKKLDAGDILLQKETLIFEDETAQELSRRLAELGGNSLIDALNIIENGKCSFIPQNPNLVTYASKIDRTMALIDWNELSQSIHNKIRAFNPWPVAETLLNGARLKIYRSSTNPEINEAPAGTIISDSKNYLKVVCGEKTTLNLIEVQFENRKILGIREFLVGYRDKLEKIGE